jgi:hypothetical protein
MSEHAHLFEVRPGGLRALLLPDHNDRLELLLEEVLLSRQLENASRGRPLWERFKLELAAHLETEEKWVIPYFRTAHPREAQGIDEVHAELRALADQVDRETALESRSIAGLVTLEKRLRAHASREDRRLYPWAVENLGTRPWKAIRAAMRSLMFDVSPQPEEDES